MMPTSALCRIAGAGLLAACLAAPAGAQQFETAVGQLTEHVAEALSIRNLGRATPADIYVRPPFDDVYGVVCAPLSRRLAREVRAGLPRALGAKNLSRARVVQRPGAGAGQFILNVSWRDTGPEALEIAVELGDLSAEQIATVDGASVEIARAELRPAEAQCLARLDVINRVEVAETPLFVHRSADVFSAEIGTIEVGQRFRLLGRMPYTDGDWAVVKLLEGAPDDPFAETVGFATVPPTPEERAARAAREAAEQQAAEAEAAARREAEEAAKAAEEAAARAAAAKAAEDAARQAAERDAAEKAAEEARRQEAEAAARLRAQPTVPTVPDPAPMPAPGPAAAIAGSWQCQGTQAIDAATIMQMAFQVQFMPDGSYSTGGQVATYSTFNNQMLGSMMMGEFGLYRFDGRTLHVTPQGSIPQMPLAPYQVLISANTGSTLTMTNLDTQGSFQCQRMY